MLKRLVIVSSLSIALGLAASAHASPIVYSTVLSGANEVPPRATPGTGTATFTLNGNSLAIDLTFLNLTGPPIAGHIHCCAPLGTNAPVAVPFSGLPNTSSGHYINTVDLSLLATYNPAFVSLYGGSVTSAEAAFLAGLSSGQTYANIHTSRYPGGEIRGQIAPSAVPEPSSLLLLGTGLVGMVQMLRRRHQLSC